MMQSARSLWPKFIQSDNMPTKKAMSESTQLQCPSPDLNPIKNLQLWQRLLNSLQPDRAWAAVEDADSIERLLEYRPLYKESFCWIFPAMDRILYFDIESSLIHCRWKENIRASEGKTHVSQFFRLFLAHYLFWHSVYYSIVARLEHNPRCRPQCKSRHKAIYETLSDWTTVNSGCANNTDSWRLW